MNNHIFFTLLIFMPFPLIFIYLLGKSKTPKYSQTPTKHLAIHFFLLIFLFAFFGNVAVISAQLGDDEKAVAVTALLFVVIYLLLLIFANMAEKLRVIMVLMSIIIFDAFEYVVLSHVNLNRFSFTLLTHMLLLVNVNIGFVYLAYKKNKGKSD